MNFEEREVIEDLEIREDFVELVLKGEWVKVVENFYEERFGRVSYCN